jgi:glycosyltransferase involved in cell wall biosynthesis
VKVLFLTASYPTQEDPLLAIFVKEHARAAAAHAEIAVVHLDRSSTALLAISHADDEEFPTWRVRYPRRPQPLSYFANVVGAMLAYRRVRRSGFEPDVIHAHFFLAGVPAVLLGKLLRKPVVVTEHWSVFLPDDPGTLSPVVRRAARFAFENATLVLPVSDALRKGIEAAGISARFRVVPNVVDEQLFHPAEDGRPRPGPACLLAVSALYEAKGYEYLLEAAGLLAAERRDFRVEIVGGGELRESLETLGRELGVGGLVTFRGARPKEEVAEWMRSADLFVLTSRYDNNPCSVLEALCSGLPVVATAVGGVPEVVRNGDGLLARPRDPESIAACIAEALDHPDRFDRKTIARDARERYGRESVSRELELVYAEVTAR